MTSPATSSCFFRVMNDSLGCVFGVVIVLFVMCVGWMGLSHVEWKRCTISHLETISRRPWCLLLHFDKYDRDQVNICTIHPRASCVVGLHCFLCKSVYQITPIQTAWVVCRTMWVAIWLFAHCLVFRAWWLRRGSCAWFDNFISCGPSHFAAFRLPHSGGSQFISSRRIRLQTPAAIVSAKTRRWQ